MIPEPACDPFDRMVEPQVDEYEPKFLSQGKVPREKDFPVHMSEIAYMTGFNTLSHFSTSFKKQFGVPPSEYVG